MGGRSDAIYTLLARWASNGERCSALSARHDSFAREENQVQKAREAHLSVLILGLTHFQSAVIVWE